MTHNPKSASDWQDLLRIAQGSPLVVERIRIAEKDIAVEGHFTLPELARLSLEDQVFVTAFLRSHGTIKEMEQTFGVSYPTIKARLTRIASQLEFIDTNPTPSRSEVLERLKNGEINAADAIRELEALK
ncbi:RNA polymerase sigma70 [Candidatus Sulfotelmatomonas gaucii]|uniref:RNA polymerase sigma70 n=1 Tax=Candidatus Sulfuritelmatomonas gaucii TaxID=2043161 RepID=A0A2N9L7Q8_9BACT|nr:RNA polymerase sigma70 [Candidatus Sulfotelmatomonas gaucii]